MKINWITSKVFLFIYLFWVQIGVHDLNKFSTILRGDVIEKYVLKNNLLFFANYHFVACNTMNKFILFIYHH